MRDQIRKGLKIQEQITEGKELEPSEGSSRRGFLRKIGQQAAIAPVKSALIQHAVGQVAQAAVSQAIQPAVPKPVKFGARGQMTDHNGAEIKPEHWAAMSNEEQQANLLNKFVISPGEASHVTPHEVRSLHDGDQTSDELYSTVDGGIFHQDGGGVHPVETGHLVMADSPVHPTFGRSTDADGTVEFHHIDHKGNVTHHKMNYDPEDVPEGDDGYEAVDWLHRKMARHVKNVGAVG